MVMEFIMQEITAGSKYKEEHSTCGFQVKEKQADERSGRIRVVINKLK